MSITLEQLAELHDAGPSVVHIREADGDLASVYIGPGIQRQLGWAPADFIKKAGFWSGLIHPDDKGRVLAGLSALSDGAVHIDEYRIRNKDGKYRWVRDESRLAMDASGATRQIVGYWTEMTDWKRDGAAPASPDSEHESTRAKLEEQSASLAEMAEELAVARDEARATDKAKSEFLAMMSHELRTPLNAIIGFSDIIRNASFGPLGDEKYVDYASDINGSGQHLLDLINDVLDLSKIESGVVDLAESDIAIDETLHSILTLVKDRAERAGVALDFDLPGGLPMILADGRKLKQILINLMSNAIKFTPPGGKVSTKVWCRTDSGVVFQIADTGIGIALEDIPKALSTFGQVDSKLTRQFDGSGLGLPLAKRLAELHGGSLDLQSVVGSGTTVTVRFPAERIRPTVTGLHKRTG